MVSSRTSSSTHALTEPQRPALDCFDHLAADEVRNLLEAGDERSVTRGYAALSRASMRWETSPQSSYFVSIASGVITDPRPFLCAVHSTRHLVSSRQNSGTSFSRSSASGVHVNSSVPVRPLSGWPYPSFPPIIVDEALVDLFDAAVAGALISDGPGHRCGALSFEVACGGMRLSGIQRRPPPVLGPSRGHAGLGNRRPVGRRADREGPGIDQPDLLSVVYRSCLSPH